MKTIHFLLTWIVATFMNEMNHKFVINLPQTYPYATILGFE